MSENKQAMAKLLRYKDERYVEATGKDWENWMKHLKKAGAQEMAHKDIALMLQNQFNLSSWWAQSITVRFEQETGRRVPGETFENTFQANISKTVNGNADELFAKWVDRFSAITSLNGVRLKSEPATSVTKKWHYWRIKLRDGSSISINFSQKEKKRSLVQVNHDDLLSAGEVEQWKDFWRKQLENFLK
jgi:hypothetical protein